MRARFAVKTTLTTVMQRILPLAMYSCIADFRLGRRIENWLSNCVSDWWAWGSAG